ncbi:Rpn family recombination-promoting nuclease/putative transposase, partial [bacterium]|nr:Rpn family recombination-promoting nuclease/putative transposase [bacterium]
MTKKDHITQLHDQFFLATMSDIKNASDFLKAKLPEEVSSRIDFSYIEVVSPVHQDKKRYRKLYSDLVIKTKLKNSEVPAEIYILFEHKTEQHPRIFIQLFSYMVEMWREDIERAKREKTKVCFRPIFPFLFYHGPGKWKVPTEFSALFCCGDKLNQHLMKFSYTLFDTAEWQPTPSERDTLNRELILHLLLFREAFQKNKKVIKQLFDELAKIQRNKHDPDYLLMILTYLSQSQDLDFDAITRLIEESDMDEEVAMSTVGMMDVEKIWKRSGYREGIEKGMEKGIEKGTLSVAKQMIQKGFDVFTIADITNLSIKEIQQIK